MVLLLSNPPAIIIVNNDLSSSIQSTLVRQLRIDQVIDGYTFDQYIAADPTWPDTIRDVHEQRIMVVRPLYELQNREYADIVAFVSHGMIDIEKNKFGPPIRQLQVKKIHWGQICVYVKKKGPGELGGCCGGCRPKNCCPSTYTDCSCGSCSCGCKCSCTCSAPQESPYIPVESRSRVPSVPLSFISAEILPAGNLLVVVLGNTQISNNDITFTDYSAFTLSTLIQPISIVSIVGPVITLELSGIIEDTITDIDIAYTNPGAGGIQNVFGHETESFGPYSVTNNSVVNYPTIVGTPVISTDGTVLTILWLRNMNTAVIPVVILSDSRAIAGVSSWTSATSLEVVLSPPVLSDELPTYSIDAGQVINESGFSNFAIVNAETLNESTIVLPTVNTAIINETGDLLTILWAVPMEISVVPVVSIRNTASLPGVVTWIDAVTLEVPLSPAVYSTELVAFSIAAGQAESTIGEVNAAIFEVPTNVSEIDAVQYNIANMRCDLKAVSIIAEETAVAGVVFSSDGTKMYIVGTANDTVYQYELSIAWSVSTALYTSVSFSIAAQDSVATGIAFSTDGTRMYILGSTSDAVYQYTLSTAWNVSTASYSLLSFSVVAQDSVPQDITFSSDGTKMYVIGSASDRVYQYNLSVPWNISTATFDQPRFSVAAQENAPTGMALSSDGTKMFVVGPTNDRVFQYTLSTPWIVSTASYDSINLLITSQENAPNDVTFSADGTKMYILGQTTDTVYQYTLPTPWSLVGASYSLINVSVTARDAIPTSVAFSSDGTKMFIIGTTNDTVYQYTLPTPWVLTGASYDSISFSVAAQESPTPTPTSGLPNGLAFSSNGMKMFIVGATNDTVYQYTLPTPWSLTGASYDLVSLSVATQEINPHGLVFSSDGTKMYIIGQTADTVFQYTLSTPWSLVGAIYDSNSISVAAQDLTPVSLSFSNDGTKMYMIGATNDSTYQYTLSSPWEIRTASYDSVSFNIVLALSSINETQPSGITFSSDGTKMYITGTARDYVYQCDLSTAWDLSTAAFIQPMTSVSAQNIRPSGISFSPDGTKLFMIGYTPDGIFQYTLSTPWVIRTMSYDGISIDISAQSVSSFSHGIAFSSDGSKLFMINGATRDIFQYTLPTPWSLVGASYSGISFNVIGQSTFPMGVAFSSDGMSMYVIGTVDDTVHQYSLLGPWDLIGATYSGINLSVAGQETYPTDLKFSLDGRAMYITGWTTDTIYQYTLPTPWSLVGASYSGISVSTFGLFEDSPNDLAFSSDGTRMYVILHASDQIRQFDEI